MGSTLCAKFALECDNLVGSCSKFDITPLENLTESLLETKLQSLEEDWQSVRKAFEDLFLTNENIIPESEKCTAKVRFGSVKDEYQRTKANMMDQLKMHRASSNQGLRPDQPTNSTLFNTSNMYPINATFNDSEICIKVPPCDTQEFYGGYEEWPSFRDMFTAIYGNHPRLTQAQKLYHLRNKTKGEAGSIVAKYPLSDQNYLLAWDALRARYENKRILVDNQLKILFNIPAAKAENCESINRIQTTISDCLSILKAHGIRTDQWDPILIYLCSTKLPDETLALWEQSLSSPTRLPSWAEMEEFLINRHQVMERISTFRSQNPAYVPYHNQGRNYNISSQQNKARYENPNKEAQSKNDDMLCKLCNKTHIIRNCPKFQNFSVKQRIDYVEKNKICSNCLSSAHTNTNCQSVFTCVQCKNKHHSLLHLDNYSNNKKNKANKNKTSNTFHADPSQQPEDTINRQPPCSSMSTVHKTNTQTNFSVNDDDILLPTALVEILHLGEVFTVRALIDSGSKRSFLTKKISKRLGLITQNANFEICGLGGTVVANSSKISTITLCRKNHEFSLSTQVIIVPNLTKFMPSFTISNADLSEIKHLKLADPNFLVSSQIDMLIGSDIIPYIIQDGIQKNILGNLLAQNSIYGWYIYGPMKLHSVSLTANIQNKEENDKITSMLKLFWETEEIPKSKVLSETDLYCEELYKKTTYRRSDGRYVVKLPFKQEFPENLYLQSSRFAAKSQYIHLEAKLQKQIDLQQIYNDVLEEYITLGHMRKTNSSEICKDGKYFSYYLPHHAVFRPESTSTKVRVVFNGSRKTKSSFSLNDVLHIGPTLQSDLMSVILNWRIYRYVFNGDIEKMYRQILVTEADCPFQRILYRTKTSSNIEDYELLTVTFGVNCAPYLAIRTLLQLATDVERQSPLSSHILRHETYVDDILAGGHTLASALEAQSQLIKSLKSAGFPLKKITANNSKLLENIPTEDILSADFLKLYDSSSTKTLGIQWNAYSDSFTYKVEIPDFASKATKRTILSAVAKLFDPAGWLTPIIVQAKILLQELWQDGVEWDEDVKPQTLSRWNIFLEDFIHIRSIQIPRWIHFHPDSKIQIHGFCDASEQAYCATIYIRVEDVSGRHSNLLVAKSKVAPLQRVSLPRLELCGALLLSKLIKQTLTNNSFKSAQLFLWSDSTIVLAWLQKHPSVWKTYVANRTSQIIENVGNAKWNHVLTHENPADLGTRGCKPQDLKENPLWWYGPMWLLDSQDNWPKSNPPAIALMEQRKVEVHCSVTDELNIIQRFSSYRRALAVIAYIYRFIRSTNKRLQKTKFESLTLSHEELNNAKIVYIRLTQKFHYSEDLKNLSDSKHISRKSSLLTLNPFLDAQGLMRVNGRLANAPLTYDERFPIIIPNSSQFCKIFLEFVHKTLVHADITLMMSAVRSQFYIPGLKRTVKKCVHHCLTCVRYKQQVKSQIMAALPKERSTLSLPFSHTGVDFAGPFQIKSGNLRNSPYMKGYACIFVCFATRAIHLEACSSLTSEAFLAAFARFIARRGLPKSVMSDNGTNFIGASKSLLKEYSLFLKQSSKDITDKYAINGLEWKFIPPSAPHMGGLWEAGVKSFKIHFRKIAGAHKFNFEEFSTLLARIESVLNSRPISPMSEDPDDLQALTPSHFLRGAPLVFAPEIPPDNLSLLNRWERLKALHHKFGQRWKNEYLQELHKRYKWQNPRRDLQTGDFVIIKDELLPPCDWRLGRIEAVHVGRDKRVRVADVRTSSGVVTRPIVKLCMLPLCEKSVD